MSYNDELFTPIESDLHWLPDTPGIQEYDVPEEVPGHAKSILVYAFATTHDEGQFQRGYFILSTKEGPTEYKMYMNFATGGVTSVTITSANVWLPVTSDRKIRVELVYNHPEKKSAAHKPNVSLPKGCSKLTSKMNGEWSQLFVTGWK